MSMMIIRMKPIQQRALSLSSIQVLLFLVVSLVLTNNLLMNGVQNKPQKNKLMLLINITKRNLKTTKLIMLLNVSIILIKLFVDMSMKIKFL